MKKTVNPAHVAEGCVAIVLGLGLLWLALTKCYLNYVTPRTLPYLYFASVVLLVVGAYQFTRIFEVAHIRQYAHLLALLIPLVLLAVSTYQGNLWRSPLFPPANDALESPTLLDETYTMQMPAYAGRVLHGYDASSRTITVMEDETYFWLTEIYNDPTSFLDYRITTMGQVLKNPKFFTADCFSPIRKLMTCCVADLFSIGFKCQYNQVTALQEGDWVTVTGKLTMVSLEESQELRLVADTVTPCSPPGEPYVYSF